MGLRKQWAVAAIALSFLPLEVAYGQAPGAVAAQPPAVEQPLMPAPDAHRDARVDSHLFATVGLATRTYRAPTYELQGGGASVALSYAKAWFRSLPKWRFGADMGLAVFSQPRRVEGGGEMSLDNTVVYQPSVALTAERVFGESWTVRAAIGSTLIVYGTDGARAISRPGGMFALRGQKLWQATPQTRLGVALDVVSSSFQYGEDRWKSAGLALNFVGGFAL